MFHKSTFLKGAGVAATALCPGGASSIGPVAGTCSTGANNGSMGEKQRFRKMNLLLPPVKLLTKRRCYLCIKIAVLVVVFGLYFMLLLRESMSALTGSSSSSSGSSAPFASSSSMPSFAALASRAGVAQKAGGKLDVMQDRRHGRGAGRHGNNAVGAEGRLPRPLQMAAVGGKQRHPFPPQQPPPSDGSNHSTLNPVYEYSDEMNAAAETDFNERRMMLWNVCADHRIIGKYPPNAWEFFISPGHGIAWCNIFKAASSTWMYYFNILGGYSVQYLQRTKASPIDLARKRFPRPTANELNDYISNTISFLIVREPFERLLSAYRNKLEGCRNKYYKLLGEQIVKKFRKSHPLKGAKAPHGPTFREFLQFLVSHYRSGGRFDEHWSPVYSFCTPCSINFTLIAKMETFQRDSEYIIRQAGLETLLLNKMPRYKARWITNRSASDTRNLIPRYFAQIDEKLLTDVLEIYQLDFELFGYNSTKYYSYVQSPDYG
ncbi:carbohydrate sulfotransferase 13-like [Anopheles marshallii]|uniref:carbohydrate sulfotransferase 13-like n=1 Tax=Anopheles marshallii TaxID=1521116 RepID=UPI00237A4DA7|nr:carbohydrate sulfotransferase 13-like [Anopheles marshallii]